MNSFCHWKLIQRNISWQLLTGNDLEAGYIDSYFLPSNSSESLPGGHRFVSRKLQYIVIWWNSWRQGEKCWFWWNWERACRIVGHEEGLERCSGTPGEGIAYVKTRSSAGTWCSHTKKGKVCVCCRCGWESRVRLEWFLYGTLRDYKSLYDNRCWNKDFNP